MLITHREMEGHQNDDPGPGVLGHGLPCENGASKCMRAAPGLVTT